MKRNLIPVFIQEHIDQKKGKLSSYVISCDICNFTPMLETMLKEGKRGAEKTGQLLNETFGRITDIIYRHNGFITNFAGDAFTAIMKDTDDIALIQGIAGAILNVFSQYNARFRTNLHVRLGISKGPVEWFILGGTQKAYAFKGSGIADAICIQQNAKPDSICYAPQLRDALRHSGITSRKYRQCIVADMKKKPLNAVKSSEHSPPVHNELFFPHILGSLESDGEFRQTVPLFFHFPSDTGIAELNEIVTSIRHYADEMQGYFNKVDFTEKGCIAVVIFGAPFTSENMIENALALASRISDEFPSTPLSAGIDYGITYAGFIGSRFWYEYTVLGDIVNTASRISCLKESGIFLTGRVKGESRAYDFNFEKNIKLKGKNEKIDIFSIESKKAKSIEFASPFVSRTSEQSRIRHYINSSFSKKKSPGIFIEGESGIGKTRLIYHVLKHMGLSFYYGQCDAVLFEPLSPVKQICASLMGFNYYDSRDRKRSAAEKYLKQHFPEKCETYSTYINHLLSLADEDMLRHISGKEIQETTFYIMREIIINACRDKEKMLVFDDMMWADEETIDFINYAFSDSIANAGIIIIYREKNRITDRLKLSNINVSLSNFNFKGVRDFLNAYFGKKPSDELLELLWSKTEGNPLFLEQITLHLENNEMFNDNGNSIDIVKGDYEIPSGIDRLIVSRLDTLSAITREGIKKASVMGKEFEILLLGMLLGKFTKDVLKEGEENRIISVLSKNLGAFRHTLLYEIAYKMQFEKDLRKLHKRIAGLYEEHYSDDLTPYYEVLYYHYRQAGIKNRTMKYLRLAIERYRETYSNEIAVKLINELLKLKISKREKTQYLIKLGSIMLHTARFKDGIKVLNKAIRLCGNNHVLCADANRVMGEIYWSLGQYNKAMNRYNKAFDLYERKKHHEGLSRIFESKGLVYYYKGDFGKSVEQFNSALKYAGKDRNMRNSIYSNMGLVLFRQGEDSKAMKYYQRALKDAEKSNDLNSQAKLHLRIALIFRNGGNYENCIKHNRISLRLNRKIGNRRSEAIVLGNMGQVYNDMGKKDKVLEYYMKALEIDKDVNNLENETIVLGNIANFYATEGEYAKSLKYYKESLKIDRQIGNKWSEAIDLGNMAELYKLQNKYREADKYFGKCIGIIRKMNARFPLAHFLSKRAELKLMMKDTVRSAKLAREAMKIAEEIDKKNIVEFCQNILNKK